MGRFGGREKELGAEAGGEAEEEAGGDSDDEEEDEEDEEEMYVTSGIYLYIVLPLHKLESTLGSLSSDSDGC